MSRVYNALTGTPRPLGTPKIDLPDDGTWANAEETPFVEIGAPGGPVFSPSPTPTLRTPAEAKVELKPEAERSFPRLVANPTPAPTYLSVKFHDIAVRGSAISTGDGPDIGLVAFHFPNHAISGEYRTLRSEIHKQLPEETSRILHFHAAAPEAGTTTVLLNLAIVLAQEGKARVLVVDANSHRPGIAAKLALKAAPGLSEALAQEVPLAWAIQPSPVTGLHVLAAGSASDKTAASRDYPRCLLQLRQWFDWILVDGGVLGNVPDFDAAFPSADAVYLVSREDDFERAEFLAARGRVKELGGLLRGFVTTRL